MKKKRKFFLPGDRVRFIDGDWRGGRRKLTAYFGANIGDIGMVTSSDGGSCRVDFGHTQIYVAHDWLEYAVDSNKDAIYLLRK